MNSSDLTHAINLYFSARKYIVGLTTMIRHYGGLITDERGQDTKGDMVRAMGFAHNREYVEMFNSALNTGTESYQRYVDVLDDYIVDHADLTLLLHSAALVDNNFGKTLSEFFDDAANIDRGCMFLVQPTIEKTLKTYSCYTCSHDDLWFCSDWKD